MNIIFTNHLIQRLEERGTNEEKVIKAIHEGLQEPAKDNKIKSRLNFEYNNFWQDKFYSIKQVSPVYVIENKEIIVITVYTYFLKLTTMTIRYDEKADAIYIKLIEGKHQLRTIHLSDNIALDFNKEEMLVGIEILDAKQTLAQGCLPKLVLDNITYEKLVNVA